MGGSFSRILSLLWSKKEIRILILGLVGNINIVEGQRLFLVGQCRQNYAPIQTQGKLPLPVPASEHNKTDKSLQIGEVVTTIPTIGFNVESVVYRNLNFNVWVGCLDDLG